MKISSQNLLKLSNEDIMMYSVSRSFTDELQDIFDESSFISFDEK